MWNTIPMLASLPLVASLMLMMGGTAVAQPRQEAWTIPDPATADHPAADAAPMSSPATYPDEEGFDRRAQNVVEGLATENLQKWREGYFTGGDPGKYLPGPAMAKLLLDPDDAEARKYMNDDRSYKDHYHFGTVNWARYYPLFADTLTDETKKSFADYGFKYGSYANPSGTENHKVMWWTSAVVLPKYTGKGLTRRSPEQTVAVAKEQLRQYVKNLYTAGQGEWDSSTYIMFDINGLLNIYDFGPDEESRLLAKAGLDLLTAGYAIKYRDGVYCGPHQRGSASGPHETIADQTGYVWFGSHRALTSQEAGGFRYAMHAITSGYRPPLPTYGIAMKELPGLPVELRNTKANYWHGHSVDPEPGVYHETVCIAPHYTMGTLWDGDGGQMTSFQIVAESDAGGVSFTGGHPRMSDHTGKKMGVGYRDGIGRYDTRVAVGPTAMVVATLPPVEEEEVRWSFFTLPEAAGEPVQKGDWLGVRVGETLIAVRSVAGPMEVAMTEETKKHAAERIVKFLEKAGRSGFIVETAGLAEYESLDLFLDKLTSYQMEVVDNQLSYLHVPYRYVVEYPQSQDTGQKAFPTVRVSNLEGSGRGLISAADWTGVYSGPFVKLQDSVLTVNDGEEGFTVDFSGEMPVYGEWAAEKK